ncbi:lanthionine synthetase LanC family protein [Cellulomonas iranensis]|uniref:Protein kinase domain-containing protein n=3 Tax=Cellulomonas iranensis TaxID=76862 RepID=A0ABU0GN91_9CELL|nr:lanthionine synthetase LanC family protein [Cellulomonas iranensis]MDQ0426827.1 hypothetical protein [Cellulomonas iranensis]
MTDVVTTPGVGAPRTRADAGPGVVAALTAAGLDVRVVWPWAKVGRTDRPSGWKLHLTCVPTRLDHLVQVLLDVVAPTGAPFKVALDATVVALLDEGGLGDSQVGKAATVYPRTDAELGALVAALREVDLPGPHVPDDVWLGGPVHARWGTFDGVVTRDVLGQSVVQVRAPDGSLVPDAYDRHLARARFATAFAGTPLAGLQQDPPPDPSGVVGGRYAVVGELRRTASGTLLQAFDLASPVPRAMILKHGRAGTLADLHGRDVLDRLRHQRRMHELTAPLGVAPRCDPLVVVPGGAVLPLEFQADDSLEALVAARVSGRSLATCAPDARATVLDALSGVGRCLATLHALGVVHRDLSPSNVLLARGRAVLSDLELAAVLGDGTPVHGKGTPGFMAPEQLQDAPPDPAMDVHAFAALTLFALLGVDPRRLPRPEQSDGWRSLRRLVPGVPDAAWAVLRRAMDVDPARRPPLHAVRDAVDDLPRAAPPDAGVPRPAAARPVGARRATGLGTVAAPRARSAAHRTPTVDARPRPGLVGAALATLASPAVLDPDGRWISAPVRAGQASAAPEVRRSLNRGAAGPLLVCAGLARATSLPHDLVAVCRTNATALATGRAEPDAGMPGLHFGETGVLLALHAARHRGLAAFDDADVRDLWDAMLADPVWWDVTHGAAGVAVGLTRLAPLVDDPAARARALRHRDALVEQLVVAQERDGSWVTPDGVPGMSGETLTGYAHGVAGIGHALVALAPHVADADLARRAVEAGARAATWLRDGAERADDALTWPYGDRHPEHWRWWCHGAPGISRLFVALAATTGDPEHARTARRCLAGVDPAFDPANLSLCHGLAGVAELLLDAGDTLHDDALRDRGRALARTVARRHLRGRQDVYWVVEDPQVIGADLMVGLAGVVHLLARAGGVRGLPPWDGVGATVGT